MTAPTDPPTAEEALQELRRRLVARIDASNPRSSAALGRLDGRREALQLVDDALARVRNR
jgi:hypothetical protein